MTKPCLLFTALAIVSAVACTAKTAALSTVTVDPATRYQTITGWEATAQAGQRFPASFSLYRDALFDAAVDDLGINRLRLEIKAGLENRRDSWAEVMAGQIDDAGWRCVRYSTVNDNNDARSINWAGFQFSELDLWIEAVVTPIRERLIARGETLYLNLNYVAFTQQNCAGTSYHHTDPREYAEFILATFLHMRDKYGYVPDAVEVILEPDNNSFWRGRQIGNAIVETAARLAEFGFTPKFIAPSATNMQNAINYYDELANTVPKALTFLGEISYHRYGGASAANVDAIGRRAGTQRVGAAMLELIGATYEDLHQDLEVGMNSAWARYILTFPGSSDENGMYFTVNRSDPNHPKIDRSNQTAYFRQYFHFVRAGAVRVRATSDTNGVAPLAFINADGTYVVVVKASTAGSASISGLPAGTYSVSYATSGRTTVTGGDMSIANGQPVIVSIPDKGVLTVAGIP